MKKILLAVDPGGRALAVVASAASIARATGAEVVALTVVADGLQQAAVGHALDEATAELRRHAVTVRAVVEPSAGRTVPETLAAVVTREGADLVAIGSHHRGDVRGLLLGSVGHRLASLVPIPVLVAGSDVAPGRPAAEIRRILVGVDGSEESALAVGLTATLARATGAEVKVVHVRTQAYGELVTYVEPADEAAGIVESAVAELAAAGVTGVSTAVLEQYGSVASALAAAAANWPADLLVVGSRRLGEVGSVLAGAVSHGVIAASATPVLLGTPAGSVRHR